MYRDYYGKAIRSVFSKINGIYLLVNHAVSYIGGVFLYAGYLAKKLFVILALVVIR